MPDTNGQPTDENGLAIERRRPGRRDVDPSLIPLLRRPAGDGKLPEDEASRLGEVMVALEPGGDALAPARGIVVGLLLAAPFWGAVAMLGAALRR